MKKGPKLVDTRLGMRHLDIFPALYKAYARCSCDHARCGVGQDGTSEHTNNPPCLRLLVEFTLAASKLL